MEYAAKGLILVAVVAYMLLPDFIPGPIDDIIVLVCGMITHKTID